jgi:hypothetical protein
VKRSTTKIIATITAVPSEISYICSMEVKFALVWVGSHGNRFFLTKKDFTQDPSQATTYDTYPEAEEALKNLKTVGYYQIDKLFVKK